MIRKRTNDEKPQSKVNIPYDYWLSRYPITNAQFTAFIGAGGYGAARYWTEAAAADFWKAGQFKGRYDETWRVRPVEFGENF